MSTLDQNLQIVQMADALAGKSAERSGALGIGERFLDIHMFARPHGRQRNHRMATHGAVALVVQKQDAQVAVNERHRAAARSRIRIAVVERDVAGLVAQLRHIQRVLALALAQAWLPPKGEGALTLGGERSAALAHYEACRRLLADELVEPLGPKRGVDVLALTPAHDAPAIDAVLATAGPRVALVVGNEGHGLSAPALAHARYGIRRSRERPTALSRGHQQSGNTSMPMPS